MLGTICKRAAAHPESARPSDASRAGLPRRVNALRQKARGQGGFLGASPFGVLLESTAVPINFIRQCIMRCTSTNCLHSRSEARLYIQLFTNQSIITACLGFALIFVAAHLSVILERPT